jgi:hypothetical protein
MYVKDNRPKRHQKYFFDMSPGDTFVDEDGDLCMKIDSCVTTTGIEVNGICLISGTPLSFDDETEYEVVEAECTYR